MAHTYSHLYNIPTTGLRFFTVYGPWGRPDMAIYLFTDAVFNKKPIKVFNNGKMSRDFTYIDDIIAGIDIVLDSPPIKTKDKAAYQILNIGNGKPNSLESFIKVIETKFNRESKKDYLSMQPGDVPQTWADLTEIKSLGYKSKTAIEEGVGKFIDWYKKYNNIK